MARRKYTYVSPVVENPPADEVLAYQCRDCGEIFEPEGDGVNCPTCGTNDCRPVEAKVEE